MNKDAEDPGRSAGGASDEMMLRALETMPLAFFSLDPQFRVTYANSEVARALGVGREEIVGKPLFEVFPATVGSGFEEQRASLEATGGPIAFEQYYEPSFFEVRAWPARGGGINVTFANIDERRRIAAQRIAALKEAEGANSRLRFLVDLAGSLAGAASRRELFERLAATVVPDLADWCTIVVPEGDALVRVAARHADPMLDGLAKRLVGTYPHSFAGPSPGVAAYKSGEPLRLAQLAEEIVEGLDDSAASTAYGRTLKLLGDGPGLIAPVVARGEVVAVLTLVRTDGEAYSEEDVAVTREIGARVVAALDEMRQVETQRAIAAALQEVALPTYLPETAGLRLAAGYRAAREGTQVGGDWYDAFELQNGHVSLVVGDAAGHGLQPAAVMAQMRNSLRAYLAASFSPADALTALSRLIEVHYPEDFATVICFELDPRSGKTIWSSAGHPAPILVDAEGISSPVRGKSAPPVGWSEPSGRPEQELRLAKGDRLLVFTDGLVERRSADIEIGIAQLMILAEQTRQMEADEACERILDEMLATFHQDDVCLLVADLTG